MSDSLDLDEYVVLYETNPHLYIEGYEIDDKVLTKQEAEETLGFPMIDVSELQDILDEYEPNHCTCPPGG